MKIRKWFIRVGAMLLVVGLSLPTSLAWASEVTVTLDAPTEVTAGSEFVARLNISYVEDFDAAVVRVRFDPAILSLPTEDANGDSIYDSITDGNIDGTTIPIAATVEKEPGLIGITTNVPGFPGVTGEGYLVEFHFKVLASGVTIIGLEHHSMSNKDAQLISSAWVDNTGNVTTSPAPASSPTPPPTNGEVTDSPESTVEPPVEEKSYSLEEVRGQSEESTAGAAPPSESPVEEKSYSLGEIRGQSEESTAGAVPPSESPVEVNWPVLGGIIGGVIVVAVVIFILLLRRRAF